MAYTYDDFVAAANKAGLMGSFSQYDLDLAKKYPEFGLSIIGHKQDYGNATTDEDRKAANDAANQLRLSYGNYDGGVDGSQYKSSGKVGDLTTGILDKNMANGSFPAYEQMEAPTYENTWAERQQELTDAILNREAFRWDLENDDLWPGYKKQYLREGERATANALAQASVASGGRPSSYAVNAASQAGDYYATKMTDVIPQLEERAYDRYLDEYNMLLKNLNTVNEQEQMDYQKYLAQLDQFNTNRNFSYNEMMDAVANQMNLEQQRYDREIYADETAYERDVYADETAWERNAALADLMASAGDFSGYEALGLSRDQIATLENAYKAAQLVAVTGGANGKGGSSSGKGGGSGDTSSEDNAENGKALSADVLAALKKKYPNGVIATGDWAKLVAGYGEEALKSAGFSQGDGGSTKGADQANGDYITVPSYGRVTYAEAERLEKAGKLVMTGVDSAGDPIYALPSNYLKTNSRIELTK